LAGRKFGEFGESSLIRQTKTIQISTYNHNLLAEFIHSPNFFCQMLKTSKFLPNFIPAKLPRYTVTNQTSFCHNLGARFTDLINQQFNMVINHCIRGP